MSWTLCMAHTGFSVSYFGRGRASDACARLQVATFKVDGMQVEQFEDLLDMWSRHREAHQ